VNETAKAPGDTPEVCRTGDVSPSAPETRQAGRQDPESVGGATDAALVEDLVAEEWPATRS